MATFPQAGFYRHYKNQHFYEVVGIARNTEDAAIDGGVSYSVLYRPLYETDFLAGAQLFSRPLDNFCEEVTLTIGDAKQTVSRFTRILDSDLIRKLEEIRDTMYS